MRQFTKILKIDITCSDTLYNTGIKISVRNNAKMIGLTKTFEHFSEWLNLMKSNFWFHWHPSPF